MLRSWALEKENYVFGLRKTVYSQKHSHGDYMRRDLDWQLDLLDSDTHTLSYSVHLYNTTALHCLPSAESLLGWAQDLLQTQLTSLALLRRLLLLELLLWHPLPSLLLLPTLLLVMKPGNRPVGNTALTLLSGQPLPSNAFCLCCLSSRYQVTSTPQAYAVHVTIYI
jgi:hypothetical protein